MNETDRQEQPGVRLVDASPVTPHNRALYEAGKDLLVESVTTGREFAKHMITVSTGAIPILLGLAGLLLPEETSPTPLEAVPIVAASLLFLAAAIVFAIGYFPLRGEISLDIIEEIEAARRETIRRRHFFAGVGFALFVLGVGVGIGAVMVILLGVG